MEIIHCDKFENLSKGTKSKFVKLLNDIFHEKFNMQIEQDDFNEQIVFYIEDEKKEILSGAALDLNGNINAYNLGGIDSSALIHSVGTRSDCRRLGYSFKILHYIIETLISIKPGIKKVFLECTSENSEAFGLYSKLQFKTIASTLFRGYNYNLMVKALAI
jgi:ribosomal protein S18 acetylase RimI-like enzyme